MAEPLTLTDTLHSREAPLADRMRPRTLAEFIGQPHILAPGRLLRRCIETDRLSSIIFYGPPGTGKTTLAKIIANSTRSEFLMINAVLDGVKEIRSCVSKAKDLRDARGRRTILFVDEVHRFNKAQQDALLPHVENGLIIFIGATTENPYFEVNRALISRSNIFSFQSLTEKDLRQAVRQALTDKDRGYGNLNISITDEALDHLCATANGDARTLLNGLELAVISSDIQPEREFVITKPLIEDSLQKKAVLYDKDGDYHYDIISAFIKSLRGSDTDAALYWLAKMVYAGEDPRFIFRRMLIFAAEDVGMAEPDAMSYTVAAAQAFDYVGMPEGAHHLASACIYLASCPKSNSVMGYFEALRVVEKEKDGEVPNHLKDSNRDKEGFGHGKDYLYPHSFREHFVPQQYLPDGLVGRVFYAPSQQGKEADIKIRTEKIREMQLTEPAPGNAGDIFTERFFNTSSDIQQAWRTAFFTFTGKLQSPLVWVPYAERGRLAAEAVRQYPDADIHLNCASQQDVAVIRFVMQSAAKRPESVHYSLNSPLNRLTEFAEQGVRFNLMIGQVSASVPAHELLIVPLTAKILAPDGVICLTAKNHLQTTRLTDFFRQIFPDVPSELLSALEITEEEVLSAYDFCGKIKQTVEKNQVGFKISEHEILFFHIPFTISPGYIAKWADSKAPFMQTLQNRFPDSVQALTAYLRRMVHQTCSQKICAEFFRIQLKS